MRYRLVKGCFRLFYTVASGSVRGAQPDGDSIWFEPNEPTVLKQAELLAEELAA